MQRKSEIEEKICFIENRINDLTAALNERDLDDLELGAFETQKAMLKLQRKTLLWVLERGLKCQHK